MATQKPKFKNIIESRRWSDIRDAWLEHVPVFTSPGAKPDPGLERLGPLQDLSLPETKERLPDVPGVRTNMLWEAVFLFHKCAHSHLAAQRLGSMGMHSWSMFNAYHSAYLGARGVMALLGVALPYLPEGGQLLIDVYPQPESTKGVKALVSGLWKYDECLVVRLGRHLDQQELWDAFQRTLRISDVDLWNARIRDELIDIQHESITKPRNSFLYKAAFWPSDDLLSDGTGEQFTAFLGTGLDADEQGFLLRLSCDVYRLFEELINDLAEQSGPIRSQLDESRIISDPNVEDLLFYKNFLTQVDAVGAS